MDLTYIVCVAHYFKGSMLDPNETYYSTESGSELEEIDKKLLNAYDEIILTINGNTINEDITKSKDEELGSTLFWKIKSYIRQNRFNVDFADYIFKWHP